jgi:hypothetical protein
LPKRASSIFSSGQVATTIIVAHTVAARKGRNTQTDNPISPMMQKIASVVRVRSGRDVGHDQLR